MLQGCITFVREEDLEITIAKGYKDAIGVGDGEDASIALSKIRALLDAKQQENSGLIPMVQYRDPDSGFLAKR